MPVVVLLALITLSEATIGVFVKLTGDAVPIQTLNFYALSFAAAFLALAIPRATGRPLRFPSRNLKDTAIIGAPIATQISVFNYAMTLVPIANAVMFGQGEDGEALGDVFLEPGGQFRRGLAIAGDELGQGGFGLGEIVRRPDRFQLSADALAALGVGGA